LLVCTSTVAAAELAPAPEDDDGAEDAEDDDGAGVADDAELCEPPELQAAARTPAAASGTPNFRASETFLDASNLFICCAFLSSGISSARRMPCTIEYATDEKAVRRIRYVKHHRVTRRPYGNSFHRGPVVGVT
jgi:hypothetical protein